MSIRDVAGRLAAEARETNQRRLLVCRGSRREAMDAAVTAVRAAGYEDVTLVTDREGFGHERLSVSSASRLLGQTREAVVVDAFDDFSPNLLGRTVGCVAGGGLYVLVCPAWPAWDDVSGDVATAAHATGGDGESDAPTPFRESLAVPPFDRTDVGTRFRERFVRSVSHPGVAVYDATTERVVQERRHEPRGAGVWAGRERAIHPPRDAWFPDAAYTACLTTDQQRAVRGLERLAEPGAAVVVEANRGRGKSAAAGIAAAALAAEGRQVVVTAPSADGASETMDRAAAVVDRLGARTDDDGARLSNDDGARPPNDDGTRPPNGTETRSRSGNGSQPPSEAGRTVRTVTGGWVAFVEPGSLAATAPESDAVIVDEAAGLSVRRLTAATTAPSAAFVTTIHGYEGAGRGFSVRFRDRLAESALSVTRHRLREPIRHAPGDPVESWAFRTLALDAREPVAPLVADATPETVTYRRLDAATLARDERTLREVFGTLVTAHYRTEPDDLARLLDAPNLAVHAVTHAGHVVSVALVAREGGLPPAVRQAAFTGDRIRGNLLPDVLTSQLRDPDAGRPVGYRVVRIATHASRRREGFASRLLAEIHDALAPDESASGATSRTPSSGSESQPAGSGAERFPPADYVGTAFGATPALVAFWRRNGYRTVHLSTTRGDASGEHSAIMLRPITDAGHALADRHAVWFRERIGGVATDALRDVNPDVVRATIRACAATHEPLTALTAHEWRVVVGAATGPGLYDAHPTPFRRLALAWLLDPETRSDEEASDATSESELDATSESTTLTDREERLLVRKVLQGRSWDGTAEALDYVSTGACMRALGTAYRTVVDRYGGPTARRERDRLE